MAVFCIIHNMVRTKHHNRTPKRYSSHRHPRRLLVTGLLLLTAATLCGLFLSYANWRQLSDERQLKQEQAAQFAALDKRVAAAVQKKIDDAKKAEAAAKAAAAADEAARSNQPGSIPTGRLAHQSARSQILQHSLLSSTKSIVSHRLTGHRAT